jgi:AraC-like DNA-binding protein
MKTAHPDVVRPLNCRRLKETELGVAQIAAEAGYENQAAFSRAFSKHVGAPPATWRARERQ